LRPPMSPHRESRIADHTQKQAGATIPPWHVRFFALRRLYL
jgi:hypothetical protein